MAVLQLAGVDVLAGIVLLVVKHLRGEPTPVDSLGPIVARTVSSLKSIKPLDLEVDFLVFGRAVRQVSIKLL